MKDRGGEYQPEELQGLVAGFLSTINVKPSGEHPETMLPSVATRGIGISTTRGGQ